MADVQGFLVEITLDGAIITARCNDVALARSKNVMSKPTMDGTGNAVNLTGIQTGTLGMNGQVDDAGHQILETSWAKQDPLPFILEIGADGTIDAGTYTGTVNLDGFTVETAADGSWDFSLSGATTSVVYAPPA